MYARGKMTVVRVVEERELDGIETFTVYFDCDYDETNPADTAFTRFTPHGGMQQTVANPNLHFEVGDEFYVDLIKIEKEEDDESST